MPPVRATEARFKADGTLTPGERARLGGMVDRQNHAIYRQRHDAQHR